ncbi:MAG TPA: alpha/beta hydrolase, partial [Gaiellaceae bacterium]|nr:alpha/beta hydrolase [Gaiellaceae bacterium]
MPHVVANDVQLFYEDRGSGEAILCIHGTSSSALVWGAAVDELATIGRVIVYDRRGCSRSERPQPYERTSVREHADDAHGLLRALEAG